MSYIIQDVLQSYCPDCGKNVKLLCSENITEEQKPAFYICFGCQFVGEVGVGKVKHT